MSGIGSREGYQSPEYWETTGMNFREEYQSIEHFEMCGMSLRKEYARSEDLNRNPARMNSKEASYAF